MGKLKRNKCFIIGFIIALIVGIVFCLSKRTFNVDEPLSYALANAPGGWVIYEPNGWVQKSIFSILQLWGNHLIMRKYILIKFMMSIRHYIIIFYILYRHLSRDLFPCGMVWE